MKTAKGLRLIAPGREAANLGFARVMLAKDNMARVQDRARVQERDVVAKMPRSSKTAIDCIPVQRLADAVQAGLT